MKRVIAITLLFSLLLFVPGTIKSSNAQDTQLTIYTYQSLLAYPGYDFVSAFENYTGLVHGSVKVVYFDDANALLERAVLEKENPQADVIIGIDNVLGIEAIKENIFQPYDSPVLVNISDSLEKALDPEHYLLPYDYGIISFYYDKTRFGTGVPDLASNITLNDFLTNTSLLQHLVVENPLTSSPGLGFFLWTIGVYGDKATGVKGVLDSSMDWRDWWTQAAPYLRIVDSWDDAFALFGTPEANKPVMISYGTSPAYGACLENDTSTGAFVTHENKGSYAWFQVEGLGITKNARHQSLAQRFVDWFLGEQLQEQIPLNQWMYPANENANVPTCFKNAAIDPSTVSLLNDVLPPTILKEHLSSWLDAWEDIIASQTNENTSDKAILAWNNEVLVFSAFLFVSALEVKRRKWKT